MLNGGIYMRNATTELLEYCKNGLRRTYDEYTERNMITNYNLFLEDSDYRKARMKILKLCEEKDMEIPSVIKDCRSVEEFIQFFVFGNSNYTSFGEIMSYISNIFNTFIDYVEMKSIDVKIIHIDCEVPQELSYDHILEDIRKCEERIENGDYSGASTSARSLLEGVCKEIIYNIEGTAIEGSPKLPVLFNTVRKYLSLDPGNKDLQKPLKEVLSGLINVVHGFNEIRNVGGDSHSRIIPLKLHHALLVVNSSKTVVNFLFHTYEYQRNLGKIKKNEIHS